MIHLGLKDKVVVVTGGNNPLGIGAATAKAFAAHGAAVFIHYSRKLGKPASEAAATTEPDTPGEALYYALQTHTADAVVQAIRQQGGQADAWEADLADPAVVPQLLDRAEKAFGPVEVLVNNAADFVADTFLPEKSPAQGDRCIGGLGPPMSTLTCESHDRHFAVNSRAVALLMAEFARRHIAAGRRWGRIINVSTDGASGHAGAISYGASKHALESYSRAAAHELGAYGISVNVVAPGPIQTGWMSPELVSQAAAVTPLGRVGQPEDVADVIVLLASEQARWLTGQLLYVGGGHRMPL
jgi:3-oxoacyl-[acyl-carrier protein] reductase